MKLVEAKQKKQLISIRSLYQEAFPEQERKPFSLILQKRRREQAEILAVENEKNEFLGLAITAKYQDMVLLDYFAVSKHQRSSGIGSKIFQMLKQRHKEKRFFLEIESTQTLADNMEQRLKRKAFYLKNGMQKVPFLVNLRGIEMEILCADCDLCFDEYWTLYHRIFGQNISQHISMIK